MVVMKNKGCDLIAMQGMIGEEYFCFVLEEGVVGCIMGSRAQKQRYGDGSIGWEETQSVEFSRYLLWSICWDG